MDARLNASPNMRRTFHAKVLIIRFIMLLVALLFFAPFYVAFVYSFKTNPEITFTGLSFPQVFHWENYAQAIEMSNFWKALYNTVYTTVPTVVIITVVSIMAAYIIARNNTKFYNGIYYLMVGAIVIPFQAIMLPLYVNLKNFGMLNNLWGFIIVKCGFLIAFNILLVTGFVKTVPKELEEAASIDGAGFLRTFWQIVFPLLKPIIFTSVVLNTVYTWNDFQIALVILQKAKVRTLPLTQFYFFGEHSIQLNLAFAAFIMSMIPLLVIYFMFQKYIVNGVMAGSVKG